MRAANVDQIVIPGGRRLTARRWPGDPGVRPFVLLHGLLDSSEGWAGLAARTERECIAIDLPGFGGSDLPEAARIDAYARDVAAALRRLGLDGGCILVGHSLGGAVAAAVAERSPLVDGLALLAPAGFGRIALAEAITLPGVRQLATAALPLALVNPLTVTAAYSAFVAHNRLPDRELVERLRKRARHAPRGVAAATQAIAHAGRADDAFSRRRIDFDGPVCALWGEHDALVPVGHIEALRRALPGAHVEVWRGMGHHPQRERTRQLQHFLEAHAALCDAAPARVDVAAGAGARIRRVA